MRLILVILIGVFLISCKNIHQKPTYTWAETTGVGLSHDASILAPPEVHQDNNEEHSDIPPGAKVTKTEEAATLEKPATTTTVIELPKDKGMKLSSVKRKTDMVGSKGFEPAKGATPTEKANAGWTYAGIGICALGIFFCTPWGGSNYRVGALIALGGIGMSIVGKFIDQIKIPAPATFLVVILLAAGVYYGYRVRHKQIINPS